MAVYTIYLLEPSGRLRLGETIERADDAAAVTYFKTCELQGEAAELWLGGRLIARRAADGGFFLVTSP